MGVTCAGCETKVEKRDRFCPVCGAPNVRGSLHPRFGPVFEPAPAYEAPPAVGPGEIECPRCTWPSSTSATFCSACGMSMAQAVLRAARPATTGVWPGGSPFGGSTYESLVIAAWVLRFLLWAVAGLALVSLVSMVARFATLTGGEVFGFDHVRVAAWSDAVMLGFGLLALPVAVGTLLFARRAALNLQPLAVDDARYPSWMSVACWFIPVANLVLPSTVVEDTWRSSGSDGAPLTRSRRPERPPFALHLWWPCLVLGAVLVVVAKAAMPASTGVDRPTWQVVLVLGALGALVLGVGALALAVVMDEVASRQARRAVALGPPAWLRHRKEREAARRAAPETTEAAATEPAVPLRTGTESPFGRY